MEAIGSLGHTEPSPCLLQFSAEAGGLHYCWGGMKSGSNSLSIYECSTEQWYFEATTGPAPSGLQSGCTVCVDRCLYTFGGNNVFTFFNDLSKLDLDTLQWSKIQTTGDQPIRKAGSGLVRVDERTLCCIGGRGIGPKLPGSTFIRDTGTKRSDGRGFTNEIHLFDMQDGSWSVPQFRGERPPPCASFTLTKVDQHRAVVFGGEVAKNPLISSTYHVINFNSMEITKMEPVEGEPWPVGRFFHAACCLNYGEEHPQLLVHGGVDVNRRVLGDIWILDVNTGKWTEIRPSGSIKVCYGHSLTATSLGPGLTEVLMFGGSQTWSKPALIAETTILRFEFSVKTENWSLVDMAHNDTRGSTQRLTEKIRMMYQKTLKIRQTATRSSDHSSPDGRVRTLESQLRATELRERDTQQHCDRLLQELATKDQEVATKGQELATKDQELTAKYQELATKDQELTVKNQELTAKDQELAAKDQELATKDQELTAKDQELVSARDDTERQLREAAEDVERSNRRAQLAEERVESLETQWVVRRNEIQMTNRELGGGGWGEVKVAKFRGIEVAAKMLYTQIRSDYYRDLFVREMNMAARLRHPHLVQFIGATLEGEMIILTELMSTSLRSVLESGRISRDHILSISVQMCQALNYLHLMEPNPVIHRDVSSANILLNPLPNDCWIAKVTDYGSVNTQQALRTENPGNPVYAAPEARTPSLQSTKMDIFSLGVLMIEMCTGRFPSDENRERLLLTIQDRTFSTIIGRCIARERDNRPTAGELLTLLS